MNFYELYQLVEVSKTFNTKDASYQLPVAADFADENNDSSVFLLPIAKKIKAFGYYCAVARQELDNEMPNPTYARKQRQLGRNSRISRVYALRQLVHQDLDEPIEEGEYRTVSSFAGDLHKIDLAAESFCDSLEGYIRRKDRITFDAMEYDLNSLARTLKLIIDWKTHQELSKQVETIINRVKNRSGRMLNFIEEVQKQFKRMGSLQAPTKTPVNYRGLNK